MIAAGNSPATRRVVADVHRLLLLPFLLVVVSSPAVADDEWIDPTDTARGLGSMGGGAVTLLQRTEPGLSGYLRGEVTLRWTPAHGASADRVVLAGYCMGWHVDRRGGDVVLIEQCGRFDDLTRETRFRVRDGRWVVAGRETYSPYARAAAALLRQLAAGRIAAAAATRERIGDSSSGHDDLTAWWDDLFRRARAGQRGSLLRRAPRTLAAAEPGLAAELRRALRR